MAMRLQHHLLIQIDLSKELFIINFSLVMKSRSEEETMRLALRPFRKLSAMKRFGLRFVSFISSS